MTFSLNHEWYHAKTSGSQPYSLPGFSAFTAPLREIYNSIKNLVSLIIISKNILT